MLVVEVAQVVGAQRGVVGACLVDLPVVGGQRRGSGGVADVDGAPAGGQGVHRDRRGGAAGAEGGDIRSGEHQS